MRFLLAVMGNPIRHSRSPELHRAFARQAGLDVDYHILEVPLAAFPAAASDFIKAGGQGFNISLPFKQQAFAFATQHSARALAAQAVNTIHVREGHYYGDNTDGIGFVRDLSNRLGLCLADKCIVIHGAGGAVRGLLPAILAEKPAAITIVNRTPDRAEALVTLFSHHDTTRVSTTFPTCPVDLIIDGSSFDCVHFEALSALSLTSDTVAYDLKYATLPTPFLQWAKRRGISRAYDGLGMLLEQAAESFAVWTGFTPNTQALAERIFQGNRTQE